MNILKNVMWINFGLFFVMLCVSVFTLVRRPEYPSAPDVVGARSEVMATILAEGDTIKDGSGTLPNLGQKNVFSTIIPLPTPTPAPTKTPDPGPTIDEVMANQRLSVALKSFASFQDTRTQKDQMVKLNESYDVEYKGKTYKIKLTNLDGKKFTATVEMDNLIGETQTKTFSMF